MTQSEDSERLLRFRLAGVPVQVVSRFGMLEQVGEPYLEEHADDEPLFTIRADDDDVAFDRAMAPEYPDPYVELCTVHRLIAEKVAPLRRVVFHSCVIEYRGGVCLHRTQRHRQVNARTAMDAIPWRSGSEDSQRGQAVPIRPRVWGTHGLRMPVDGQGRLGL